MIAHRRRAAAVRLGGDPQRTERGAAMVEFAIVVSLLAVLIFGVVDLGYQWRFAHETIGASRAGARVGAGLGSDATTDYYVLTTLRTSLDSAGMLGAIDRVIVYNADSDGNPPAGCLKLTGLSGACQVYPASVVTSATLATSQFNTSTGCYTGSGAMLQNYCAKSRDDDQRTADYLGVMVIVDADSITGMFPDQEVRRRSVMRMEPQT